MNEKIQWYEEILQSDPSSTLFFPLAQLYLQKEEKEKAAEVLQKGIEKHPEHVEARLLLCDLYYAAEKQEELDRLVQEVSSLLSRYTAFWSGWAESLRRQGEDDMALAVTFLGSNFSGTRISWSEVLRTGIGALFTRSGKGSLKDHTEPATVSPGGTKSDHDPAPKDDHSSDEPEGASEEDPDEVIELVDDREELDVESIEPEESEAEAPTTYRTKTMADILAGQGDFEGALEIYNELLDETSDSEKRSELQERIQSVQQKQAAEEGIPEEAAGESGKASKQTLLRRMEKLAERLEARS